MKLTATKFLAPLIEPFMDWFSPLSGLYRMVLLTLMCVALALAYKVVVGLIGWLHQFSRAVPRRHDDAPNRHD